MGEASLWVSSRKAVVDTFFKTITLPRNEFNKFRDFLNEFITGVTCDNAKGTCQFSGECKKY